MGDMYILNETWMQDKIYIWLAFCLVEIVQLSVITYCWYRYWLRTVSSTFCRRLNLEVCVCCSLPELYLESLYLNLLG
jgi:hypothetical protein